MSAYVKEQALQAGSTALVMPYDEPQFINTDGDGLSFLCGMPLPRKVMCLTLHAIRYSSQEQHGQYPWP
jgi:hypothetical protein